MMNRRRFLFTSATLPLLFALPTQAAIDNDHSGEARAKLARLEHEFGGRLGVHAIDTATSISVGHRDNERFPFCSTFKLILVSAILARSREDQTFLQRRIRYRPADLVHYSPITEKHVGDGMTVAQLCAAAIQYSDNSAANQLIKIVGGPAAVTAYARSIGNHSFRLDRWETELNTCIPGDPRDTATPASMARSMLALALGKALPLTQQTRLDAWLRGNTTGGQRIRAAIPEGWPVGDKTGTGDYGTANDIAVIWPPRRKPIVLVVYTTHDRKQSRWNNDVIVSATRIVLQDFALA